MCACADVFARVRAHACVFMRGCVCACEARPTRARVHACLRARARMRRVHVYAHSHADARVRMCMGPHEGIRLYMYVGVHEKYM
jgi:hypothetical protein